MGGANQYKFNAHKKGSLYLTSTALMADADGVYAVLPLIFHLISSFFKAGDIK